MVKFGEQLLSDQKETENKVIEGIAKNMLGIDSLETVNSDRHDFHDLSVWQIKAALEAAYKAGYEAKVGEDFPEEFDLYSEEQRLAYNGKDFR